MHLGKHSTVRSPVRSHLDRERTWLAWDGGVKRVLLASGGAREGACGQACS